MTRLIPKRKTLDEKEYQAKKNLGALKQAGKLGNFIEDANDDTTLVALSSEHGAITKVTAISISKFCEMTR